MLDGPSYPELGSDKVPSRSKQITFMESSPPQSSHGVMSAVFAYPGEYALHPTPERSRQRSEPTLRARNGHLLRPVSALAKRPLEPHLLDLCAGTRIEMRDEVQDFIKRLVAVRRRHNEPALVRSISDYKLVDQVFHLVRIGADNSN